MPGFPIVGPPGVSDTLKAVYRRVFYQPPPNEYLPQGRTIDGSKSRDPGAGTITVLRPGLLLGKITSSGFYAPSVIGTLTNAETGASTQHETTAAAVTELVRRIGATGTYKITGPPTAAGTVRTLTATYSATSGTDITITALGVSDVWTLTAPAGQDAGMYQLEVTTGKGTSAESIQVTAALAANANTATVDAAVEALSNVGAGNVAAVYADPTLTLTFHSNLGPVHVRVLADTTNDVGVFEGGWAAVHTTTGVDGRFIAGSLIQPTDGSETLKTFVPEGYGIPVVSQDGLALNKYAQNYKLPIGGCIDFAQLLPAVTDTSLKTWVRENLSTLSGGKFTFSDQY